MLASQQYGRGKAIAFTAQDSWQWQMHASIPLEDQTHEQFWRQMLRWLVDGVPDAVDVRMTERVEPGEPVQLEATVVDKSFVELNDAVGRSRTWPGRTASTLNVPLQWTGERDGQYRGTFVSAEAGAYEVTVDATRGAETHRHRRRPTCAPWPARREFFDPTMHAAPLRRIAEETGGRFYTPDDVSRPRRRRPLRRPRRDGGRRARAVEHADHPDRA